MKHLKTDWNTKKGTLLILTLLLLISSIFLISKLQILRQFNPSILFITSILLIIIPITIVLSSYYGLKYNKNKIYISTIIGSVFLLSIYSYSGYLLYRVERSLDDFNKDYHYYSNSLVVLDDSNINTTSKIKASRIGYVNSYEQEDENVNQIRNQFKITEDNEMIEFNSNFDAVRALYNHEVVGIIVNSNYGDSFKDIVGYEKISDETSSIATIEWKQLKSKVDDRDFNIMKDPFTILLLGIDTRDDRIDGAANADAPILLTVNPKKFEITMTSIPRDSYVEMPCSKEGKDKFTHVTSFGRQCLYDTVENLLDVHIDYNIIMNFNGIVKLVDAIDGITIESPVSFCVGDACFKKGLNKVNGTKALIFARDRYHMPEGAIQRGYNQQEVIKAIVSKSLTLKNPNKMVQVLDIISNNLDTNLTTDEIIDFYKLGMARMHEVKKNEPILNYETLYLTGYDSTYYHHGIGQNLYTYVLYQGSISDVKDAIAVSLGLKDPATVKHFAFSAKDEYEPIKIGMGPYNEEHTSTIPTTLVQNFVGKSLDEVLTWANRNKIIVRVNYLGPTNNNYNPNFKINTVIAQSNSAGKYLKAGSNFIVDVNSDRTRFVTIQIVDQDE